MSRTINSHALASIGNLIKALSETPERFRDMYDAWCTFRKVQAISKKYADEVHSFDKFLTCAKELAEHVRGELKLPENRRQTSYWLESFNMRVSVCVMGGKVGGKYYPMSAESGLSIVDHSFHF
jgi:hypothetical protein